MHFILRLNCNKHLCVKDGTNEFGKEECVKVQIPAHQFSRRVIAFQPRWITKFSMDQSELGDL